jgi:hypothetical protein
MLKEIFKTLFPSLWENIYVVRDNEKESALVQRVREEGSKCADQELKVRSIIPWTECTEGPDYSKSDDYIYLYIVEFSCVEYGIVQTLCNKIEQVFRLLYDYLCWYLNDNQSTETAAKVASEEETEEGADPAKEGREFDKYLHFGMQNIPESFAPDELKEFLKQFVSSQVVKDNVSEEYNEPIHTTSTEGKICSYCNRPISVWYELENGKRFMCARCHDSKIERQEILEMYDQTKEFMEGEYDIKLNSKIHVRFSSTADIEKRAGKSYDGRILGYYNSTRRELALETPGPKVAIQDTLIHELTHCWQYDNLDIRKLEKKLRNDEQVLEILEGHAVYVEIDAMRKLHESNYADRLEDEMIHRDDEYGRGYMLIKDYLKERENEENLTAFSAMKELVKSFIDGERTITTG